MYQKIWFYNFSQIFLSELLILWFAMSDLSDSLMIVILTWTTWAIRSQSLICPERSERIAHSRSFDLSNLSEWANERMSNEWWAMGDERIPGPASLVWYYCYRIVLGGNKRLELELEHEPTWGTKVEPEQKPNNFGSATLCCLFLYCHHPLQNKVEGVAGVGESHGTKVYSTL